MRCAEGERGVRRAREPDVEVARIGEGLAVKPSVSSSLVAVVMRLGGRRVRVEGKWPVWKVVWWRRRVPFAERGSKWEEGVRVCGLDGMGMEGKEGEAHCQDRIGGYEDYSPSRRRRRTVVCRPGGNWRRLFRRAGGICRIGGVGRVLPICGLVVLFLQYL